MGSHSHLCTRYMDVIFIFFKVKLHLTWFEMTLIKLLDDGGGIPKFQGRGWGLDFQL